ncbi:MAG: hypothetical protein AAB654_09810 [Acidobacteriota bacterium]
MLKFLQDETLRERFMRSAMLILCLAVFLIVPLRIIAHGYLPIDDALRHSAHAVDGRDWGEVILMSPEFRPETDGHPGWHRFLRFVHQHTNWSPDRLVYFSVALAFFTFTVGGLLAFGNPPAWFMACALMSIVEPAVFARLSLGRPFFFSMAALVVMLCLWTRPRPVRWWLEAALGVAVFTPAIVMYSSAWYLWAIPLLPLMVCRRWRSLLLATAALAIAIATATLVNGWYNTLFVPLMGLKVSLLQSSTVTTNLVSELQPSGGPYLSLVVVMLFLTAKCVRGAKLRAEIFQVDFCLILLTWTMGLFVGRFWSEWGLPAMTVWMSRQILDSMQLKLSGLSRRGDTIGLMGLAAGVLYLGLTADIGGRYTQALRNPLLIAPFEDFAFELPAEGGVLYSPNMQLFYAVYHRLPYVKFRFSTAFEPGIMPPEDLKVLRDHQAYGLLRDYKPWFEKMTSKDRIVLNSPMMPEWPEMEFKPFYGSWIGRKTAPSN